MPNVPQTSPDFSLLLDDDDDDNYYNTLYFCMCINKERPKYIQVIKHPYRIKVDVTDKI